MVRTLAMRVRTPIRCFAGEGDGGGGATGTPPEGTPPEGTPPEGTKPNDDNGDALGDAGKRALEEERRARKTAEREAKAAKTELENIRQKNESEQEKAVREARDAGKNEALTVANSRLVRAEVINAASGKLLDPSDAAALLDLSEFTVDDDGNVDTKAITKAVDDLLKSKPHLAATARPGPLGGAQGRTGSSGTSPNDWLRQQAGLAG